MARELFNHFNHRNMDAIIKLVKTTLEKLRKRIWASQAVKSYLNEQSMGGGGLLDKKETPVFKCYAVLAIPIIVMQPSLDEVQQSLNKSVQFILNVSKQVTEWTRIKRIGLVKKKELTKKDLNKGNLTNFCLLMLGLLHVIN